MAVVTPQQDAFSDFSTETDFAKFKLIVEDKTLFINPSYLAERSPVFKEMFFGDGYKESAEQAATIEEESHKDILAFLQCLFPCSHSQLTHKPINPDIFPSLVRLADKFQVQGLTAECERFLLNTGSSSAFVYTNAGDQQLVDMLLAAVQFHLSEASQAAIIGRVALIDDLTLLAAAPVDGLDQPQWQRVMTALLKARDTLRDKDVWRKLKHSVIDNAGQMARCAIDGCGNNQQQQAWECRWCSKWLCRPHAQKAICHWTDYDEAALFKLRSLTIDVASLQ